MSLTFSATVAVRNFDVKLSLSAGETIAVLGPNGAGKSTLVDLIAGLLMPDSGRAVLDDRVLFDRRPGHTGKWLPPHRRGVSLLSQEALLFPHLNARDNVAFGPRSSGLSRRVAAEAADSWLAAVDASEFATRRPSTLSGGQAQRVAVARALAPNPKLLLLDEPMAALDVSVVPQLRRLLRTVLAERTTIVITHDVLDAYTLADRVLVLNEGRIVEQGNVREVLDHPQTAFTAELAGLNLIAAGSGRAVAVRPVDVEVRLPISNAATSASILRLPILDLEQRGDFVRVRSERVSADVPPAIVADLDLVPGTIVEFVLPDNSTSYPLTG
jgi:molybdate transport system ATP-binding protein